MNELRRRRGKGKTRVDYSVGKKEKRRRKSLVVAKFRHFFGGLFSFLSLSLSSAGGIQGPGISGRLDKKKKEKRPWASFGAANSSSGASQHSSTRKREAAASNGHWYPFLTPHFNLLFIITILARSLARSYDNRETWKVKEKIMK